MNVSLQDTEEMQAVVGCLGEHVGVPVELAQVFGELGLEELGGNYTDAELSQGDAFLLAAALAAVVARAKRNGGTVDLAEWGGSGEVVLRSDVPRVTQLATAMKYFALDPVEHRVAGLRDENTVAAWADEAESLRGKLD